MKLHRSVSLLCLMSIVALSCRSGSSKADGKQVKRPTARDASTRKLRSQPAKAAPAARPPAAVPPSLLQRIAQAEAQRRFAEDLVEKAHKNTDARIRMALVLGIGRSGSHTFAGVVRKALHDRDASVRRVAAFATRLLYLDAYVGKNHEGTRASLTADLLRAFKDEKSGAVRSEMLWSIGWIGKRAQRKLLRAALRTPQRTAALFAYGQMGRRKVFVAEHAKDLLAYLGDKQRSVRLMAAWAVARLDGGKVRAVAKAVQRRFDKEKDSEVRTWLMRSLKPFRVGRQLDWFISRLRQETDPTVQVEFARTIGGNTTWSSIKLSGELRRLWREVASNHYRLTGAALHAVLEGLSAIRQHARVPTIKQFLADMLAASNAAGSVVKYSAKEAHGIDLVHCRAAMLLDIGLARPDNSPTCGTARAEALDIAFRKARVINAIVAAKRQPPWKLTLLKRYLFDKDTRVRREAIAGLAKLPVASLTVVLPKLLQTSDPAEFGELMVALKPNISGLKTGRDALANAIIKWITHKKPGVVAEAICAAMSTAVAGKLESTYPSIRAAGASSSWAVRNCASEAADRAGFVPDAPKQRTFHGSKLATRTARKAVIVTYRGVIELELFPQVAPVAVANFVRLAQRGAYDGLTFHRVVPNFVVQGGDPRGDGWGGPGYVIPCELSNRPYQRGSLGMALAGRDTAGSQFFITHNRQPHLDGRYPLFGQVVKGMKVVDALQVGDKIKSVYVPKAAKPH